MTSVRRNIDRPRRLLVAMQRHAKRDEIDLSHTLLKAALDDPARRDDVVAYLAAYISRCLSGVIPDLDRWTPPE